MNTELYNLTLEIIWKDIRHPDIGIRSATRGYLIGMAFAFDLTGDREQAQECRFLWNLSFTISRLEHL